LIAIGFISPEIAYTDKSIELLIGGQSFLNLLGSLHFLLSPILFAAVPIALYLWDGLKKGQKIGTVVIILSNILMYIAIGTNKGIFDYVIMLPIIIYARQHAIVRKTTKILKSKWNIIIIVAFTIFSLTYFTKNIVGRTGNKLINYTVSGSNNSFLMKIVPEPLMNSYIALDSYLTQGYFALDNCFDMEYKSTYGVGHSVFLTSIVEKYMGKGAISKRTYQQRLEASTGYSSWMKWHTFYVWMANDLTFIGVLIFIFILGYWFSIVWLDILCRLNLLAIAILPLFLIMFFYFSANNQILGFPGQSIIFWVLLIAFFYDRRKSKFILIKDTNQI
jgi:hypothetical protein